MNSIGETRETALVDIAEAEENRTAAVAVLILCELREQIDERRPAEEQAARVLSDAIRDLTAPEERLSIARHAVAECQVRIAHFTELAEDPDLDTRVDARISREKYLDELEALNVKADFADSECLPYRDAKAQAKRQLELEQRLIAVLEDAMLAPFSHPAGQATAAYRMFRAGEIAAGVLMARDRTHPEWASAKVAVGAILLASGLRDEDFGLPDPNKVELVMADSSREVPDPAPSMVEVMNRDRAYLDNLAQRPQPQPEHLYDRVPRTVTERPELNYVNVPQEYRRV